MQFILRGCFYVQKVFRKFSYCDKLHGYFGQALDFMAKISIIMISNVYNCMNQ